MTVGGDLFSQQEANRRKSSWLLIGFMVFFAWVGFGGDIAIRMMLDGTPGYRHQVPWIGIAATAVTAGIAWGAWRWGDRQVLWSTRAMELVTPVTAPQQRLTNVVEEMAIAAGLPVPRIWIVPDDDPNAFATGISPEVASIAVTEGLLERLDRDQLQAVVAHEMAHVMRYDTRLMTLVAATVGAIALMSDGLGRLLWHGRRGGRAISGNGGRNPLGVPLMVLWLITLIVAPLVSRMMAMALSRRREFLADATAAQFTRNPGALAGALAVLDGARGPTRAVNGGAAHLCIVDPADRRFQRFKGLGGDLLASHPPIEARIARLREMGAAG